MVQHIEHLRPELQTKGFMYREIPVDGEIPLRGSEPSQKIPRGVPLTKGFMCLGIGRRVNERAWIKRLPPGVLGTIEVEGLPDNQVWTNEREETSQVKESRIRDSDWLRRAHLDEVFRRPASQKYPI